ncbi:MAG: hypothetical protein CSA68_12605 [Rhodobacterales bacterium]|nr:MAG: hypothetical protein CSA68_12605 [Rhodobacterales bacterium]
MQQESAETLALQALAWLVGDEELCSIFLGSTGVSESELRARAGEAEFLSSVLDFLMMDDAWVMRFCDSAGLPYDIPYDRT